MMRRNEKVAAEVQSTEASSENINEEKPNPFQFSEEALKSIEYPSTAIEQLLHSGETIIDSYIVLIKGNRVPLYLTVIYLIISFGLYAIILWIKWMQEKRICCCQPSQISMKRGKMAITSKGRVIVWKLQSEQVLTNSNEISATTIETQIYSLKDLKQVTSISRSKHCDSCLFFCTCAGCGCQEYSHYTQLDFTKFSTLNETFDGYSVLHVDSRQSKHSAHLIPLTVFIETDQGDIHHSDLKSSFQKMSTLHRTFLQYLSTTDLLKDRFIASNNIESCNMVKNKNEVTVVDDINDVSFVSDNGLVTIPSKFLNLCEGEEIIDGAGLVYSFTLMDWILAILTIGIYYLLVLRKRRWARTALILTNKRFICMDILHRSGMIPGHMGNYSFLLRYFFPDEIIAGRLSYSSNIGLWEMLCSWILQFCHQPKNQVNSSIECHAGSLTLSGPEVYIGSFVKSMHQVTSRQKPSRIVSELLDEDNDRSLNDKEKKYIPFLSDETVVMRHRGPGADHNIYQSSFQPCCNNMCRRDTTCFPTLPLLISCTLRPFLAVTDYIATDHTLYNVRAKHSLSSLICPWNEDEYEILWIPLEKLKGSSLIIQVNTHETPCKVLWHCLCPCYLTRVCCNMTKTEYKLVAFSADSETLTMDIELNDGKKWKDDVQLQKTQLLFSKVIAENMMDRA